MANFDADIRRITEEVLSDGTVDEIIRTQVSKSIENAITSSFRYGELEKVVQERVNEILVPFIKGYPMDDYIVKLDSVLTEIVQKTALVDNKEILSNFKYLMTEPQEEQIKLSTVFREYKHFVERNMETSGRKVSDVSDEPEYEAMCVAFEFEEDDRRSWGSLRYATVDFTVDEEDQEDGLNRTVRLCRWEHDRKDGWEIRVDAVPDLYSLRHLDKFDMLLMKLSRAGIRLNIDETVDEDYVYSDEKPEARYE